MKRWWWQLRAAVVYCAEVGTSFHNGWLMAGILADNQEADEDILPWDSPTSAVWEDLENWND